VTKQREYTENQNQNLNLMIFQKTRRQDKTQETRKDQARQESTGAYPDAFTDRQKDTHKDRQTGGNLQMHGGKVL
jgi:hypothetical protein